jgi:uncharacterized membrane protein (UPF0127 family)
MALRLLTWPAAGAEPSHLLAGFPRGQAVVDTAGPRCLLLEVYFAVTPQQRAQGLMFVESLPEFEGMYFGNAEPVEIVMWMKNTIVPLDMLFIRGNGVIAGVARDTRPFSTDRIGSGEAVAGVLEVNAGFARRWRADPGTRLQLLP